MPDSAERTVPRVVDVIGEYGRCIELVPIDKRCRDISVGIYLKDGVYTVWTFSRLEGAEERIEQIRERIVALGGMTPVPDTRNQVRFECGENHPKPVKFLFSQAVGKNPDFSPTAGEMRIKDTKTALWLAVEGREEPGRYVYRVSGEGSAPNVPMRLRMVVAGFLTYGEMKKASDTEIVFPCGHRHDELLQVLLPYSRNISAVESMIEAEAVRGQMTTSTLGFSPL